MPREAPVFVKCDFCSKEIKKYACWLKRLKHHYCSYECKNAAWTDIRQIVCGLCGKQFARAASEIRRNDKQFCSRECYQAWRMIDRKSYPKKGGKHIHRTIAEAVLGRPLTNKEVVHHIDEDKLNFDLTNLAVLPSQSYHAKLHRGKLGIEELQKFSLKEIAAARASGNKS